MGLTGGALQGRIYSVGCSGHQRAARQFNLTHNSYQSAWRDLALQYPPEPKHRRFVLLPHKLPQTTR